MVHIARLGSDLIIPMLLALAATIPVILLVQRPPTAWTLAVASASCIVLAGAVWFGLRSYRTAAIRVQTAQSLRVAAISVDGLLSGYSKSTAYRDVEA